MSEKVVEFNSEFEPLTSRKPRTRDKPGQWECSHHKTELDQDLRLVTCKECAKVFDAFDYLVHLSKKQALWVDWYKRASRIQRAEQLAYEHEAANERSKDLYFERPPATAKVSRAAWDKILAAVGVGPPSLHRYRRQVWTSAGGRYALDYWIAVQRKRQMDPKYKVPHEAILDLLTQPASGGAT